MYMIGNHILLTILLFIIACCPVPAAYCPLDDAEFVLHVDCCPSVVTYCIFPGLHIHFAHPPCPSAVKVGRSLKGHFLPGLFGKRSDGKATLKISH